MKIDYYCDSCAMKSVCIRYHELERVFDILRNAEYKTSFSGSTWPVSAVLGLGDDSDLLTFTLDCKQFMKKENND
mgnify:CR=1 FL=1